MYHAKTSRTGTAIAYRMDHAAHVHQVADHPTRCHNNHPARQALSNPTQPAISNEGELLDGVAAIGPEHPRRHGHHSVLGRRPAC